MGSDRTTATDLRGFLVPDLRIGLDSLQSKTATPASTYTETGPRTGVPAPDQATSLVLAGSGEQAADSDLEILTQRAGGVGYEAAGYLWRSVSAGHTTSQYRGWDGPQIVSGWETLYWSLVATGTEIRTAQLRLASGLLMVAYTVSPLGVIKIGRLDPSTGSWTNCDCAPDGAGAGYLTQAVGLVQLPSGRIVLYCTAYDTDQIDGYYSDDDGDSWTIYCRRIATLGAYFGFTTTGISVAYSAGELLLIQASETGAAYDAAIFASSDLGLTFRQLTTSWNAISGEEPYSVDVLPMAGGGFIVTYYDDGVPRAFSRRFGSAWQLLADTTAIQIENLVSEDMASWRDEDGVIYCVVCVTPAAGSFFRTIDEGMTWDAWSGSAGLLTVGPDWTRFSGGSIAGRAAIVTRWIAAGSAYDSQSVAVVWLGGFSTHTAPGSKYDEAGDFADTNYVGWGEAGGGCPGGLYLPFTVPGSSGWVAAGAGSEAQTAAAELEVTTAAGQTRDFTVTLADDGATGVFAEVALEIDAGDGSLVAEEITLRIRASCSTAPPGIFELDFELRFSSAGYQVYDRQAAANVGAAVTYDLTTTAHVRVAVDSAGNLWTWHSRGGHVRSWTAGRTGTLNVAGVYANPPLIHFGHPGAAANVSRWTLVGYCFWVGRWGPYDVASLAGTWANPTSLHPRSYPTSPALVFGGARIAALGGPTRIGETQRIATRHDYPLAYALPEVEPCPRVPWRSLVDEADLGIAWDLGGAASGGRWLGTSIGLALLGSNVRTAKLQYYTGAAWSDVIAHDAASGWSTLPYVREGDVVYPDSGTASSSRWLPYGAAVGAAFLLDASTPRKILAHSEGVWEDATTKRPWIRIELTGGEAASGTGAIVMRSAVTVRHEVTTNARYWRLLIPSQVTLGGYYEIGSIIIGHIVICGYQWSRGISTTRRALVDRLGWPDGQERIRRLGPAGRTIEIAWTDGSDATQLQGATPDPDYVSGSSSGLPIAARSDGPRLVEGLLAAQDGPSRPVLLLTAIPRGTGSQPVADPSTFCWGRLAEEISRDHVLGDEGRNEVERSGRLVLREVV